MSFLPKVYLLELPMKQQQELPLLGY